MADLFDAYELGAAWDEMIAPDGSVRAPYRTLHDSMQRSGTRELRAGVDSLARAYLNQGVTFDLGGEERPFPLDIVPRVIDETSWEEIDGGVRQRVRALEAFLADVYGPGKAITDGVVPRGVVTSSKHFHRAAYGIEPPNGVRVHVAGIDLIRDEQGGWRVLEDNVRVPSGVSYVLANRSAMRQQWAEVLGQVRLRPVSHYPQRLLAALRAAAPAGVTDPNVVVLTPGVHNSAYFEHAWLARAMGVELVEGRDLTCSGGVVRMRDTGGERRVDVVYRRVDDDFLDPLCFRPDSMLGVAGLMNAYRMGNVALVNAVGTGVCDDKAVYAYVPRMIRFYLGQDPILPNVKTYICGEEPDRKFVLEHLHELVVKATNESGGYGMLMGHQASQQERDEFAEKIKADPRNFIAQPIIELSQHPSHIDGRFEGRRVDLRPYILYGEKVIVMPGGLTRVALRKGSLVVNSSQGGGSKDTWVLEDGDVNGEPEAATVPEISVEANGQAVLTAPPR